jgi:hypothetical protein
MRLLIILIIFLINSIPSFAAPWEPIIGIPEPPFGLEDHNTLYGPGSGATYDYSDDSSGPVPYRIGPDGPYTHYIDPDHPNATNTDNLHGTHQKPRVTFPTGWENVPPGSVVEIHGNPAFGGKIFTSGTQDAPIFYRGVSGDEPVHSGIGGFFVEGSYLVFENIKFDMNQGTNPRFYFGYYGNAMTNIAVRNCEFYNGLSVPTSSYQVIRARLKNGTPKLVQNLILHNNSFHDIGENRDTAVKMDAVAISLDSNVKNVWITRNEFTRIGGDGVQLAWDSYRDGTNMPQFVYVGKNKAYDNYENFIDLKMCQDVIVSQNTVYNIGDEYSSYSGPTAIPFRYGLGEGPDGVGRNNIWTLFNVAHSYSSADGGFSSFTGSGEKLADEIYYIGNVAYDAHNAEGTATAFFSSGQENVYWINNTAYNCDRGGFFIGDAVGNAPNEKMVIVNNVFGDIANGSSVPYNLMIGAVSASLSRAEITNNIYYNSSGNAKFRVGIYSPPSSQQWSTYNTFSGFIDKYSSFGIGSAETIPGHIDAANGDFHITENSPAAGKAVLHGAYATFENRYGISIKVDFDNKQLPNEGPYDIGAFSISSNLQPLVPKPTLSAVKNLSIVQ